MRPGLHMQDAGTGPSGPRFFVEAHKALGCRVSGNVPRHPTPEHPTPSTQRPPHAMSMWLVRRAVTACAPIARSLALLCWRGGFATAAARAPIPKSAASHPCCSYSDSALRGCIRMCAPTRRQHPSGGPSLSAPIQASRGNSSGRSRQSTGSRCRAAPVQPPCAAAPIGGCGGGRIAGCGRRRNARTRTGAGSAR